MTLKLHIFWGFLTIYRIQQSYQECIEIKRRYDLNANFIDTIKIVLRDGNNTTFECNEGFIALKTLSNEVKCISKSEVRKDTGQISIYLFFLHTRIVLVRVRLYTEICMEMDCD